MNGIGVVIYGPEASGTKWLTQLIRSNAEDQEIPVLRYSLPFDTRYIPLAEILGQLDRNDTRVLITSRRIDCHIASQIKNGHAKDAKDALLQIQRAYSFIFSQVTPLQVLYLLVNYESLADEKYRQWVIEWALDCKASDLGVFKDGNVQYLEEEESSA